MELLLEHFAGILLPLLNFAAWIPNFLDYLKLADQRTPCLPNPSSEDLGLIPLSHLLSLSHYVYAISYFSIFCLCELHECHLSLFLTG